MRTTVMRQLVTGTIVAAALFSAATIAKAQSKWEGVRHIRYEVIGEFESQKALVINGGTSGLAHVKDRVELRFNHDEGGKGLLGEVSHKDFPSEVSNLRNGAAGCAAPVIREPFEQATIQKVEPGYAGDLHLTIRTRFAAGGVPAHCTGALQFFAASEEEELIQLPIPGHGFFLFLAGEMGDGWEIDPRTDTIVLQAGDWKWTYKLTPVR